MAIEMIKSASVEQMGKGNWMIVLSSRAHDKAVLQFGGHTTRRLAKGMARALVGHFAEFDGGYCRLKA